MNNIESAVKYLRPDTLKQILSDISDNAAAVQRDDFEVVLNLAMIISYELAANMAEIENDLANNT